MTKYLTSILIIFFLFSCKEIQKENFKLKIDDGIKKIDKIIEKKDKSLENEKIKKNQSQDIIFYHIGEPYFIEGVKYIPEENYNYSEVGISTYYGKELHNIKTINNDINKVTELLGRHKTLPIPSMVTITNLDNGLSLNIKIIDRHNDNSTLIQVSRKVGQLLGFYKDGIATVRVEILPDASKQWKNVIMSLNEPQFNETISSAPTELVSISEIDDVEIEKLNKNKKIDEPIELKSKQVINYNLFLKVNNFKTYSDIQSIISSIDENYKFTSEKNGDLYELIIGPVTNIEINKLVPYLISKGYKETEIIFD